MKKVAFCFLIYDVINHEELWKLFFDRVDPSKYSIYIHYKTNTPLKFFDQYKLPNCIQTRHADLSIVIAQNILLDAAMRDNNTNFIFLSNSCVPFKSFDTIYAKLDTNYSYFNLCPQVQCFPRCNTTLQFMDPNYIQKASQWCILNRKHAELMLTKMEIKWFDYQDSVADEHCYITTIYYHHLQNEIITTPNLANGATTFTNWPDMDYPYVSQGALKNYSVLAEEELLYLMQSPCFFGRKFNKECITFFINKKYLDFITSHAYIV